LFFSSLLFADLIVMMRSDCQVQPKRRFRSGHQPMRCYDIPHLEGITCSLNLLFCPPFVHSFIHSTVGCWLHTKVSGFPSSRVIGTGTSLDSSRFRHLLAEHLVCLLTLDLSTSPYSFDMAMRNRTLMFVQCMPQSSVNTVFQSTKHIAANHCHCRLLL
jgi:hypothetical protein